MAWHPQVANEQRLIIHKYIIDLTQTEYIFWGYHLHNAFINLPLITISDEGKEQGF